MSLCWVHMPLLVLSQGGSFFFYLQYKPCHAKRDQMIDDQLEQSLEVLSRRTDKEGI